MPTCPSCINTACPSAVTTITISEATMDVALERYVSASFSGKVVALPYTPSAEVPVQVFVNGVLQRETAHYTIDAAVITFLDTLASDDVVVLYAAG